jgi:two-component system, NarL family, nitrate/nitrite response regulator NarL
MVDKNAPVRILIADDHTIFRDGLKMLISDFPEFRVAGEAESADQALDAVAKLDPDILLLDLVMPGGGGMRVLRSLAESGSRTRVVLLSGAVEGDDITKAFELGARGLMKKDAATATLIDCIRAVLDGKYWIGRQSASTLDEILQRGRSTAKKAQPGNYRLTPREMQVIKLIVSANTNKDIARELSISQETVKHHITSIFDKLGVYNRLELTLFVFHHGIVDK